MEELFQTVRTEDFECLFVILEDIIHKYGRVDSFLLPLLRICNGILGKLSSTSHTKFIGRVHKLIANVFKLSHKSGVNFKGLYNKRVWDENLESDADMQSQENDTLAGEEFSKDHSKLSYEFYQNFWLLQKYISDPFKVRKC